MKPWLNIQKIVGLCSFTKSKLQTWIVSVSRLQQRLRSKMNKAFQDGSYVRFSYNEAADILQAARKPMIADLLREARKNQPKVEAFGHFMDSRGLKSMNSVAKEIGTGLKRLFRFLREQRVFFLSGETNLLYQRFIESGYFKVRGAIHDLGRTPVPYCQILITPKGKVWIAKMWRESRAEMEEKV